MCRAAAVAEMLSEVVPVEDTTGRMQARAAAAGPPATEDLEGEAGEAIAVAAAVDAVAGGGADERHKLRIEITGAEHG